MPKIIGFHRGKSSDVIMVEGDEKFLVAKGTEFKGKGNPSVTHQVETSNYPEARRAFQKFAANA